MSGSFISEKRYVQQRGGRTAWYGGQARDCCDGQWSIWLKDSMSFSREKEHDVGLFQVIATQEHKEPS